MTDYHGGSPNYYDYFKNDARKDAFWAGATVSASFRNERIKSYQRRRRCSVCDQLVGVRTSMHEGMVCDACREKVKDKPIEQVRHIRGGITFVDYEYTEEAKA